MYLFLIIVLLIIIFFPYIKQWAARRLQRKAEDYLRSAMGMPPRDKSHKTSQGNQQRQQEQRRRGRRKESIIPEGYAEDADFKEIDEPTPPQFHAEEVTVSFESQVSDAEWEEVTVLARNLTLYVADLDGTLLNSKSRLSRRTVEMLNTAIAEGAQFTVATARTPATVSELLKDVDMKLPAIVMTGSAMWHPGSHNYDETHLMPASTAARLLEIYTRRGLPTFVYTLQNGKLTIYHTGEMSPLEQKFMDERLASPYKEFRQGPGAEQDLVKNLDKVLLFYTMQPDAKARDAYEEIKSLGLTYPLFYHDIFGEETAIMEIFAPEVSKAAGVRRMAKMTGARRIVVFGDNVNDIPMMQVADEAVAVSNAVVEVKSVATKVIGPNDDDSVAREILDDLRKQG